MKHAAQEFRLTQQAMLAPRLQQSVRLLQMSTIEFTDAVQQALNSNPFLEDADDNGEESPSTQAAQGSPEIGSNAQETITVSSVSLQEQPATLDCPYKDEGESTYSGDYPEASSGNEARQDVSDWVSAPSSLRQHLSQELGNYVLSDRDRLLTNYVIDALDDDGYLHTALEDLAKLSDFSPVPDLSEWRAALQRVQQLDAPGLGARSLRECLELQLRQVCPESQPIQKLALDIVQQHLDVLGRNDFTGLQRLLHCPEHDLRLACSLIRSLDPKPGRWYDTSLSDYVIPDVIVRKEQSHWRVLPNRAAMPSARLNQAYAAISQCSGQGAHTALSHELQEARWLLHHIEQRYATIERVAQAIVGRQRRFFEYGEIAIRPLMLRDIALELNIHESTVSRASANKYMLTPRGIVAFRHFFSRELATESGGSCSSIAVRTRIRELIESENPQRPMSDVALAHSLATSGIVVARRTVSKYRTQLNLPAAEMRRHH